LDSHVNGEEPQNNPNNPFAASSELPPAMSEVEDSDSDDDDLYLENDEVRKAVEQFKKYAKASQPNSGVVGGDDISGENEIGNSYCPYVKQEESNADHRNNVDLADRDDNDGNNSYEEEMIRHQLERRNSPNYSGQLAKISEDSDENQFAVNANLEDADAADDVLDPIVPSMSADNVLHTDQHGEAIDLPTPRELSKELCKVVATEHFTGQESLFALEKLSKWAHTQDSTLLKHFLTYGGVVKVIDFLAEQIENANCKVSYNGDFLMEAIHKAADVICNVCFVGKHGINEDIAVVNATVVVKYGGIETLLMASDAFNKSDKKKNPMALKATEGVWNAIMNVYCNAEAAVTKKISLLVLDASVKTMNAVGKIDHPIAAEALANVFNSLYRITYHDFVSKEEIHQKELLKHCMGVFKRDVTPSEGDEELLEEAISFLYGCHEKKLLDRGTDYECVLPLCVMGLQEFAHDNENIREWASKLLDGAISNIEKKESIMIAEGAIEALAPFLTFEDVDAEEKQFLRSLIRKIVAV
jgi:glutaredoxin